jgi:hypothetical protein
MLLVAGEAPVTPIGRPSIAARAAAGTFGDGPRASGRHVQAARMSTIVNFVRPDQANARQSVPTLLLCFTAKNNLLTLVSVLSRNESSSRYSALEVFRIQ